MTDPIRIPLAVPFELRPSDAGALGHDPYLVNCFIESQPDGRKLVVKRAGSIGAFSYNAGGATNGQGTVFYKGGIFAMGSNVLYNLSGSGNASASGAAWTASTAAPWTARDKFGCVVFNGIIFVMGGAGGGGFSHFNDVWSSPDGVNWTQVIAAAPWAKRHSFGLVVLGSKLFLVGGSGTSAYNDVWSTPDGVNWTQVVGSAPWEGRLGVSVVGFNQGIILMGGQGTTYHNDVWFSPDGVTWTQLVVNAGWSARAFSTALVYANKLWIFGGVTSAPAVVGDVWSSPDGINWTNTGSLPAVRDLMPGCVYANKMFLVGGADGGGVRQTTVWSTTDGVTFTAVTATYGGSAVSGQMLVAFRTPNSVSALNAYTMWMLGGNYAAGYTNNIYRATLNQALFSSVSPATSASTTEQWQFATQNAGDYLIAKNTKDAWVFNAGTLTKITSTNYPQSTVSGLVNLDDTLYVMDANGVIYGSNLSTPFVWSSLNFITADYESDTGVALVKYQNYVLALKSTTMQFFYDAGRYPGSPLLPAINYNARVGCVSADTVVAFNNTVIWVARTDEYGPFVAVMEGTAAKKISTQAVDLMLSYWVPVAGADYATAARIGGHYFYYLSLFPRQITLVYDFTENQWHIAKTGTSSVYDACNYVTDGQYDYMQSKATGNIWQIIPRTYDDAAAVGSTPITCSIQSMKVDGGRNSRKFTGALTVIGDMTFNSAPNNINVQWSNDDGQTYSAAQTVDLTKPRPRIARTGSFLRRQWKLTHASTNPLRLEALEQEVI